MSSMMSIENVWHSEPLFAYNWAVYVVPPTKLSNNGEALTYRAKTVTIPGRTFTESEIQWRRSKVTIAGKEESSKTFDINFWLDVDLSMQVFIDSWLDLIGDKSTGLGVYKKDYIGEITVALFDNSDRVITDFTYYNVWPQSRQDISLDNSGGDPVEFNVTFACDKCIFNSGNTAIASTTNIGA